LATAQGAARGVPRQVGHEAADDVPDGRVAGPLVLGAAADDRRADGDVVVERVALVEDADPEAAAPGDAAGVGLEPAGEQPEQAGLAVAVPADDPDPVALVDPEGHRVEDDAGRVLQVQGLGPEQMCHGYQGRCRWTGQAVGAAAAAACRGRCLRARRLTRRAARTIEPPEPTRTASVPSSATAGSSAKASSFMRSETVNPMPPRAPAARSAGVGSTVPSAAPTRAPSQPPSVMPTILPTGRARAMPQNAGESSLSGTDGMTTSAAENAKSGRTRPLDTGSR